MHFIIRLLSWFTFGYGMKPIFNVFYLMKKLSIAVITTVSFASIINCCRFLNVSCTFMYMLYYVNADLTKMMAKRYVPPGARSRGAANSKNHAADFPRTLDDVVRDQGGDVFTVILRSENTYGKI